MECGELFKRGSNFPSKRKATLYTAIKSSGPHNMNELDLKFPLIITTTCQSSPVIADTLSGADEIWQPQLSSNPRSRNLPPPPPPPWSRAALTILTPAHASPKQLLRGVPSKGEVWGLIGIK